MTSEMEKIRKELEKKRAQAVQLDKWAEAVKDDLSTLMSSSCTEILTSDSSPVNLIIIIFFLFIVSYKSFCVNGFLKA